MEGPWLELLWPGALVVAADRWRHEKAVPYYIFAQAVEGRYVVTAGGEEGDCGEGGAFVARPNVPLAICHRVSPRTKKMRIRFLHFRLRAADGLDALSGCRWPLCLPRAAAEPVGKLIDELLALPGNPRGDDGGGAATGAALAAGPETLALALRRQALGAQILARLLPLATPAAAPKLPAPLAAGVARARRAVAAREGRPILPEELAAAANMSRSAFYRAFQTATGLSPAEYVLRERINHAARLLLERPGLGVKEVARRCGWKNPYHFSRAFKKVLGRPPGGYYEPFYL